VRIRLRLQLDVTRRTSARRARDGAEATGVSELDALVEHADPAPRPEYPIGFRPNDQDDD
jgi:hypothetical protein